MKIIKIISKIFFLIVIIVTFFTIYNQYVLYRYESQIGQELELLILEAQILTYQLEHQLEHHLSDVYIEIAAREMGLVGPTEILLIPIN